MCFCVKNTNAFVQDFNSSKVVNFLQTKQSPQIFLLKSVKYSLQLFFLLPYPIS
jgi:hypothetical protein